MQPFSMALLAIKRSNGFFMQSNRLKNIISRPFHLTNISACNRLPHEPPPQDIFVYEGSLKTRIKRVKLLSLTSSMLGFAMLPVVFKDLSEISIALGCGVVGISSFFLATPFLLDWITKRYVIELHYDTSTQLFTATIFNLVCQRTELQFSAADVAVPDVPGLLTSFLAKGRPLFVDVNQVKDFDAYCLMMGYDKPLDLKLSIEEKKRKQFIVY